MLNPINFITPPLLFLYVSKFCLEERLARPPAVMENFLSLLIFPAPYGATDTSPAGCSRPCSSQQTSSGSGCHLHRPVHLSEQNRAQQNGDSSSVHLTAWVQHQLPDKIRFSSWNAEKCNKKRGGGRLKTRLHPCSGLLSQLALWKSPAGKKPDISWHTSACDVSLSLNTCMHVCSQYMCVCVCAFSGDLKFAYGRAMEESISSWFVID